jgi:ABC-type transporter Mla MlaB component
MSPIRSQIWKSEKFAIERIEDLAPGVLIYHFSGAFAANEMYRSLKPAVVLNIFDFKPLSDKQPVSLHVFDLTQVPTIDSSALGLIVSHYISCRGKGIRVIAVGVNPNVMQLLKFTKLDSLIPMAATVEEAIAAPRS